MRERDKNRDETHARRGTVTAAASLPPEIPPFCSGLETDSIDTPLEVPFPAVLAALLGIVPFHETSKAGPGPAVDAQDGCPDSDICSWSVASSVLFHQVGLNSVVRLFGAHGTLRADPASVNGAASTR